jgi:NADH dehydrogenase FAD-containing subunit
LESHCDEQVRGIFQQWLKKVGVGAAGVEMAGTIAERRGKRLGLPEAA